MMYQSFDYCVLFLQTDVILVDIDGGHVSIPDSINLPYLSEPFLSRARHELTMVSLAAQSRNYGKSVS